MHDNLPLEALDLFFTSTSWTLTHLNTTAYPLAMTTSNHVPFVIQIQNSMPQCNLFVFENWWMAHDDFLPLVESIWTQSIHYGDATKRINAKMKILRKSLKIWAKTSSKLKDSNVDINALISMLDAFENSRSLSPMEASLRTNLKQYLTV